MLRFFSMIFFLLLSSIGLIVIESLPVNNITTSEIMNRIPVLLVPANYVYFICLIIFLFLLIWLSGFWKNRFNQIPTLLNRRAILFNSSLTLTVVCVLLWHYEFFTWMMLIMIGLLCTVALLYFSYPKTENELYARVPISLFFGWIIFSLMFVTNYLLILGEWNGWGISQSLWSVIFLTITTAIGLHFLYHYKDIAFNSVLMWGFIGIALKNGFDALFVTTAALFLTGVIGTYFLILKSKEKTSLSESIN